MRSIARTIALGLVVGGCGGTLVPKVCNECQKFADAGPMVKDWTPGPEMTATDIADFQDALNAWQGDTHGCVRFRRVDSSDSLMVHKASDLSEFPDWGEKKISDYDPSVVGWYYAEHNSIWYMPQARETLAREAILAHEIGHWLGIKFGESVHSSYGEKTCMSGIIKEDCLVYGHIPQYDVEAFLKQHSRCGR